MRPRLLLRVVGFLAVAAGAFAATGPLTGILFGLLGLGLGGRVGIGIFSAVFTILLVGATWLVLRFEGASLASIGLSLSRGRATELGVGLLVGVVVFGAIALVQALSVGASLEFAGPAGLQAAVAGLPLTLALLLPEELLFRGYAFRRLADATGDRTALLVSACAFGLYHLLGSGHWAMGAVFQFAMPAIGGLVFGYAALRTGGLALPIGLHLGGNWIQASVFGFGVRGSEPPAALLRATLTEDQVRALTAPDLTPHLPFILGCTAIVPALVWWSAAGRAEIIHQRG
jgi:hypothetical protein